MDNLRKIRDELLSLHKTLMNIERANYEAEFGKVSNVQLLNLLFENQHFIWLRDISILVAEIDELFASKMGIDLDMGKALLEKTKTLFDESDENKEFKLKYQANLNTESLVSAHHEKLMNLFENEKA